MWSIEKTNSRHSSTLFSLLPPHSLPPTHCLPSNRCSPSSPNTPMSGNGYSPVRSIPSDPTAMLVKAYNLRWGLNGEHKDEKSSDELFRKAAELGDIDGESCG